MQASQDRSPAAWGTGGPVVVTAVFFFLHRKQVTDEESTTVLVHVARTIEKDAKIPPHHHYGE